MFRSDRAGVLAFTLFALWLAGCNSTPTRGVSLFPQGHKLTEAAKSMRDANARALHVPRELDKVPQPAYTVEPGDVLLVQSADLDSPVRLPADQPVLPDGTINLGKYGHPVVMGQTVPEIEAVIRNAVKAHKETANVTVRLVARQSKVYYVVGEVNSPGAFPLSGRETVLDAIMQAGGLTDRASRDNIILTRPSRPTCPRIVLPVCWKQIVQLGDTTTNYQIAAGDRIYVPTRGVAEMIPLVNRCVQTPCKSMCDTPQAFPPHPGDSCVTPSNEFRGNIDFQRSHEPMVTPKQMGPASSR